MLQSGGSLTAKELETRVDEMSVTVGDQVRTDNLDPESAIGNEYDLYRNFTLSDGNRDAKPTRLGETTLLEEAKGRALYQFALTRHQFHPEDLEGCNGMFTHDAFFGDETRSYLGQFANNRLRSVERFADWDSVG